MDAQNLHAEESRKCIECGAALKGKRPTAKYCSRACESRHYRKRKRQEATKAPDEVAIFVPEDMRRQIASMVWFFKPADIANDRWKAWKAGKVEWLKPKELESIVSVYPGMATFQRFGWISRHLTTKAEYLRLKNARRGT